MKHLTYSLKIPDQLTFEDILESKDRGGRFVFFQYLFPRPFLAPVIRISKIHYLHPGEKAAKYCVIYNVHNLLLGWWGLPFGPGYTIDAIKSNFSGIDITEDIYANLTEESFLKRTIAIAQIATVFIHPDRDTVGELTKCFKKFVATNGSFRELPVFALFTETENPYYVIGLNSTDLEKSEEIRKLIYKYFYKENKFDLIDINDDSEFAEKLKTQGLKINCQ